jgi:hypothetical protein
LSAPANTGGEDLRVAVSFDERVVVSKELRIAVDRWVASDGVSARGGCSVGSEVGVRAGTGTGTGTGTEGMGLVLLVGLVARRYMRAKYAVQD